MLFLGGWGGGGCKSLCANSALHVQDEFTFVSKIYLPKKGIQLIVTLIDSHIIQFFTSNNFTLFVTCNLTLRFIEG